MSRTVDGIAELLLHQVEAVIEREPSEDALFDLLRIASPKISKESLTDEKLYKKLILWLDFDDKNPLYERANKVLKSLDTFYSDCVKEMKKESSCSSASSRKRSCASGNNDEQALEDSSSKKGKYDLSTSGKEFPSSFSVFRHVKQQESDDYPDQKHLEAEVAFQCINARGEIVHGRKASITYKAEGDDREKTVKEIFERNGGCRILSSVDSIKEELMERGPVVSTSFKLTSAFLNAVTSRKEVFETNLENSRHPVLIVGWENTTVGEVWKICSTTKEVNFSANIHQVAFRQWGIDDECVVPKQSFETWTWQEGPYFDVDLNENYSQWCKNSTTMDLKLSSEELGALSSTVGDLIIASNSHKKFTLRNAKKLAESRSCILTNLKFHAGEEWNVSVKFTDSDSESTSTWARMKKKSRRRPLSIASLDSSDSESTSKRTAQSKKKVRLGRTLASLDSSDSESTSIRTTRIEKKVKSGRRQLVPFSVRKTAYDPEKVPLLRTAPARKTVFDPARKIAFDPEVQGDGKVKKPNFYGVKRASKRFILDFSDDSSENSL
ncbi:predicted protein [Chaetoceros tenuissimus]|uniref:Uncharacterized protein n=1 Tax=Chaetoceros tenuissimus TaxID=426638 RepID=A0AAD3H4K0_9STRA|nr:predicted protein [Chaetoceros tenuissimus]